jgi:hypothetical protein
MQFLFVFALCVIRTVLGDKVIAKPHHSSLKAAHHHNQTVTQQSQHQDGHSAG